MYFNFTGNKMRTIQAILSQGAQEPWGAPSSFQDATQMLTLLGMQT